jgi:hypothetical protein
MHGEWEIADFFWLGTIEVLHADGAGEVGFGGIVDIFAS